MGQAHGDSFPGQTPTSASPQGGGSVSTLLPPQLPPPLSPTGGSAAGWLLVCPCGPTFTFPHAAQEAAVVVPLTPGRTRSNLRKGRFRKEQEKFWGESFAPPAHPHGYGPAPRLFTEPIAVSWATLTLRRGPPASISVFPSLSLDLMAATSWSF